MLNLNSFALQFVGNMSPQGVVALVEAVVADFLLDMEFNNPRVGGKRYAEAAEVVRAGWSALDGWAGAELWEDVPQAIGLIGPSYVLVQAGLGEEVANRDLGPLFETADELAGLLGVDHPELPI